MFPFDHAPVPVSESLVLEIVPIDPAWMALGAPIGARVLVISNQFLLLGVHRDHRLPGSLKGEHLVVDVLELGIAVRVIVRQFLGGTPVDPLACASGFEPFPVTIR